MNSLGKLFLKGLAVVIPVVLTIAILWWMAAGSERLLGGLLTRIMPQGWYVPGLGLAAALAIIVLVGLLSHVLIFQKLFEFWERMVSRLPLVKTIYTAIKDFISYFSPDQQERFSKVVLVTMPGQSFQIMGFVTRAHPGGNGLRGRHAPGPDRRYHAAQRFRAGLSATLPRHRNGRWCARPRRAPRPDGALPYRGIGA